MPAIPPFVLKKLYLKGSLQSQDGATSFRLKNVIAPGTITGITGLVLDAEDVDLDRVSIKPPSSDARSARGITSLKPLQFPIGSEVCLTIDGEQLPPGEHLLIVRVVVKDVGPLQIPISDTLG